ncbi:MAG TPA: DNA replication terminus site-binding protein [Marinospirillum sp.]|uniref:DNA replication terminus site-binding protein n=1 Tax=Marinospirillum sp. TaxID=2183934 RepID=UPI002B49D0DD|nr:DNA replication terminus site-binding protein [Marinospirillum sp.]HKM15800.1 DNA replication terminus site-binding protein [Marinospirillum sp.]
MGTHYRLVSQLDHCFDLLVNNLNNLAALLKTAQLPCWMLGCETEATSRERLLFALLDLWYLEGQDGRVTRSYPGLVVCNEQIWAQLGAVNDAKVAFSGAIDAIRRESPDLLLDARQNLVTRHPKLHAHLTAEGLARLHLKQSWRQIPGCTIPLRQVRFSWYSSGRSIRRISYKEAVYRLEQMNVEAPHIKIQLQKLASIPTATPLAQVQSQAPLMRANLFFTDQQAGLPDRQAMNIAMPLFILSDQATLPPFNIPSIAPPEKRTRAVRSDAQLEDEPFLPSIRVFKYREY